MKIIYIALNVVLGLLVLGVSILHVYNSKMIDREMLEADNDGKTESQT